MKKVNARRCPVGLRWWSISALAVSLGACSDGDTIQGSLGRLQPPAEDSNAGVWPPPASVPDAGAPDGSASDLCGNGQLDPDEVCDGTPGCNASCALQVTPDGCGDGRVTAPEECDDGNTLDGDSCSSSCLVIDCGNGRVDPGETCDRRDETCSPTCQTVVPSPPAECGNARLDALEECDPPDLISCDAQCRRIICGDGRNDPNEACDDGNLDGGDGCSSRCTVEVCGNGVLDPHEDCEPPSSASCDAQCRAVRVECGDGVRHPSEECDDGNLTYGDGCSPTCKREACGNGRVEAPAEQCEPPGSPTCTSQCRRPRCGDGELSRASEECEDGNADNGDGCSASCRFEVCGNGVLDVPEQCEPPGTATCDERCRAIAVTVPAVEFPIGGALFELQNPGFDGSLSGWSPVQTFPESVRYAAADADGSLSSGSVELGAELASTAVAPSVFQCVRSAPGARYHLSVAASAVPSDSTGSVRLRATFHEGATCSGGSIDGVTAVYSVGPAWTSVRLPPVSPVPGHSATFAAPLRTRSMSISLALEQGNEAGRVRLDNVELVRASSVRCGNGIPEEGEQCEPILTAGCSAACELPSSCGDGVPAPGECGDPPSCPEDCPRPPAVCGDDIVSPPEECDPPEEGSCSEHCTVLHAQCGNGQVEPGEECDPPNGWTCSSECESIRCGDGIVEDREQCEPPGTAGCSERCRSNVSSPGLCGNGLLEGAEECDPPSLATWCSPQCLRRNPRNSCGDGRVDLDLGEQCDPPGYDNDCGGDCRSPACGDGKLSGREQCEPTGRPDDPCGTDCRFEPGAGSECYECLESRCSPPAPEPDLFSDCFDLQGIATSGTGAGRALRDLCVEAVECMRRSACDVESAGAAPNPLSCYCGKWILVDASSLGEAAERLRACREGLRPATGACREEFERAAEAGIHPVSGRPFPATVLAAATGAIREKPALNHAFRLMTECGHADECGAQCAVVPKCGDGVVGWLESCDPGDPNTSENCDRTHCTILPCGNGIIDRDVGETCDVADPYTSSRCGPDCRVTTQCGDGIWSQSAEACDGSALGQSWADCCRPTALGPADPSQLEGCDHDRNGLIDDPTEDTEGEGCRFPQVCGNGVREGTEQCDDGGVTAAPDEDRCDDNCMRIDNDPCSLCSKEFCLPQRTACFSNSQPSNTAGCNAVFECIQATACGIGGSLDPCLCGDLQGLDCAIATEPDGACAEPIIGHSGCAPNDAACVWSNRLNPAFPTGLASQLAECHNNFCFDQCFGTAL